MRVLGNSLRSRTGLNLLFGCDTTPPETTDPAETAVPPAPRPLVNRCPCGKRISDNRKMCLACYYDFLREIARQIESQEILDAVLGRNFPGAREEVLNVMRPHLKFLQPKAEIAAE